VDKNNGITKSSKRFRHKLRESNSQLAPYILIPCWEIDFYISISQRGFNE